MISCKVFAEGGLRWLALEKNASGYGWKHTTIPSWISLQPGMPVWSVRVEPHVIPNRLLDRGLRWEPRAGKRDAVRGFARFDVEGTGTRFTYSLEPGLARTEPALSVGDPAAMVAAFTRWMAGGA